MNAAVLQTFIMEARSCARAMLESGTYIEQELPNVSMEASLHAAAAELCTQLVGTKHDIIHELSELDDLVVYGEDDDRVVASISPHHRLALGRHSSDA